MMPDPTMETLLAKQAIRDALSRYCRGLDRMDKEMARAVFHEDATVQYYGIYEGSGHGFVDWAGSPTPDLCATPIKSPMYLRKSMAIPPAAMLTSPSYSSRRKTKTAFP